MADRPYRDYDDRDREIVSLNENMKKSKDQLLKKELGDYSNASPEVVAQLIRNWMNSEK